MKRTKPKAETMWMWYEADQYIPWVWGPSRAVCARNSWDYEMNQQTGRPIRVTIRPAPKKKRGAK